MLGVSLLCIEVVPGDQIAVATDRDGVPTGIQRGVIRRVAEDKPEAEVNLGEQLTVFNNSYTLKDNEMISIYKRKCMPFGIFHSQGFREGALLVLRHALALRLCEPDLFAKSYVFGSINAEFGKVLTIYADGLVVGVQPFGVWPPPPHLCLFVTRLQLRHALLLDSSTCQSLENMEGLEKRRAEEEDAIRVMLGLSVGDTVSLSDSSRTFTIIRQNWTAGDPLSMTLTLTDGIWCSLNAVKLVKHATISDTPPQDIQVKLFKGTNIKWNDDRAYKVIGFDNERRSVLMSLDVARSTDRERCFVSLSLIQSSMIVIATNEQKRSNPSAETTKPSSSVGGSIGGVGSTSSVIASNLPSDPKFPKSDTRPSNAFYS